ncbi:glycosyltransferase family 4 protein [Methanogenium sp. S4BF]|nr:glycosyltransferase family 4 protein [Methanogenium sp. S4BF]
MSTHLHTFGSEITVLAPHPTFPTGTFERVWKPSSHEDVNGVNAVHLWTWQPTAKDPGFVSRMFYYLIFPVHASLWILTHSRNFDLIITSSPPIFTHIPGRVAKTLFHKEWIMDIRDLWIDASVSLGFLKKGSIAEKMSRAFERRCLEKTDQITVTTSELGERISSDNAIQNKIVRISNGVNTAFFKPSSQPKKNQIVYAGNIGYAQDLELVIRAMKIISEKYPLKFIIAGAGDIKEHLEDVVKSEGLEEIVLFPGTIPREAVPQLIAESLIGVAPLKDIPTLEYAAPTKVYEYMACGTPFVGCGKGEISRIANGSGGGIIADNTPEAIATTILDLVHDPAKRETMARSGREYVVNNFDRGAIAAKLNKIIEADR